MKRSGTKTGLFLMELVLALLIFGLCAAICLQIFSVARSRARESEAISKAVFAATSAAEAFKATGGDFDRTGALLDAGLERGSILLYYDGSWNRTRGEGAEFSMEVMRIGQTAVIMVSDLKNLTTVFSLTVKAVEQ